MRTKQPTVQMNPARNELKGKVPTMAQYTNCAMPVSRMYARNVSMICTRLAVRSRYELQKLEAMVPTLSFSDIFTQRTHTAARAHTNTWRPDGDHESAEAKAMGTRRCEFSFRCET